MSAFGRLYAKDAVYGFVGHSAIIHRLAADWHRRLPQARSLSISAYPSMAETAPYI